MSSTDKVDKNQHVKSLVTAKPLTKNNGKKNIKGTTKETKKETKKEEELKRKYESQQENDTDDNKNEDDDDDDYSDDSDDENTKTQKAKEAKTNAASKKEENKKSPDKIMKNTKGTSKTVEDDTEDNDDEDDDDDDDDSNNELNPKDLKTRHKVKTVNDDDDDGSGDADNDEDEDDDGDDEDDDDSESDNVDDGEEDKSKGEKKAKKVDDSDDGETDDDETEEEEEKNEKQEENNIEEDGKKNSESEAGEEDESGDETASSIPSLKDDDSRKGSDDDAESLNSSQQPILRLSAMSHISGMSDVLPKKVTPEPEVGEETVKEGTDGEGDNTDENNDEKEAEHEGEDNNEKELDENGEQIKDGEMPQEEVIESDRSFSPVDVSLSDFDDKDSDCFNERTITERELSTRQAETPSDRAESTLSHVSVRNKMMSFRNVRENEEGALTSEPEFEKTHNAKSREIMRRNKHRIWYEIPETSDDDWQRSAKTRKKTQEKRRAEMRARSRRKRSTTSAARSANRDSRNNKSAGRKQKKKPRRKRAQKEDTSTSIVLLERTEKSVTFEECNSSCESIRPIDSAMSIRVVEDRYDFFEEFSDSRSSVDPDSSGESGDLRRKQTPDIESEEEVKPKKRRRGKTKNNAKDAKDKGEENAKDKGEQKRIQKDNDAKDTAEQRKVNDKEQDKEKYNREDDTSEVNLKKKKKKKREDKEEQEVNQYDDEVHELTKQDNEVLEEKSHEGNDRNQMDDVLSENEKKDSKKITSESEVDNHNHKDRGDSGFSRSTQSSSPISRHASSKWAYRTINLHPDSESEVSGPQPEKKDRLPKWKRTSRKKAKELPVVRGIPRVIRRVKTETMLMAATSRLPPEKNWGKPKNHSANVKVSRIDHTVVDRVLSANRHKVTKLESRLSQLIKELTKEREENRTLRLIQQRQEKKLEKVIGEEAELPQLLVKHTAEVKSLRERLRKVQDVAHQKDEKLHEQDKIILKLRDRCKYYKDLCDKDELTEKSEMQKNLLQTQENLKKRDEEISKLQRMLNLKEKTHSRNLKEQKEKLREAQDRLQLMEENCNNLQGKLRVREKQLDYTNIYQRQIVLKEKTQMPVESPPRMAALPAPKRNKPRGKNSPKSKTKGNKTKEINKDEVGTAKGSDEESNKKPSSVFLTAQSDKESGSDKDINTAKSAINDNELPAIMDGKTGAGKPMVNGGLSDDELKDSERRKREEFEKDLRQEEERLRKEKEEVERRLKDIQEKEEREKAEREAKWREDSARRAREAEERRQASARRQEEERRKEEERQIEERKRDEERREDERKREQEGREQERIAQGKKPLQSEDSFFEDEESRRKKDALLARLKAMDSDKASDEDPLQFEDKPFPIYGDNESSKPKASKSYEARNADKNLHNGLPAFPKGNPIVSPPESVKSDPDGVFGVPRGKPVLIGRGNLNKKNTNQFSWLDDSKKPVPNKNRAKPNNDFNFGDYSPSVSDKKVSDGLDGDIFNTDLSRRAGRGRRREGGLGGDGLDFGERRGSGGLDNKTQNNSLGFLSDDFGSRRGGEQASELPSSNSPLLPRRRAAQGRNGPAAISSAFDDNLDDDIEEFTL